MNCNEKVVRRYPARSAKSHAREVRLVTAPGERVACAKVLSSSFTYDPLIRYLLPHLDDRLRVLARSYEISEADPCALTYYVCDVSEDDPDADPDVDPFPTENLPRAAAIWFVEPDFAPSFVNELQGISQFFSAKDFRMMGFSLIETLEQKKKNIMKDVLDAGEQFYHLVYVGCDAFAMCKGYGSGLLQPMLDRADEEGKCCYLESSNGQNVPFYERLGFRVVEEYRASVDAPMGYFMRRDPVKADESEESGEESRD